MRLYWGIICALLLTCSACKKPTEIGYLKVEFAYLWGTDTVRFDQQIFANEAAEELSIASVQFFANDMSVYGVGKTVNLQGSQTGYFSNDSKYRSRTYTQDLAAGKYEFLEFLFGFDESKNVSNLFSDEPERSMFWPEPLGGGYHYMKIDGKWKLPGESTDQGYGLHLGRLMRWHYDTTWVYDTTLKKDVVNTIDSLQQRYPKHFKVRIPANIVIVHGELTTVTVFMDIKKWFDGLQRFEFAKQGSAIMQNEEAMEILHYNGPSVFRCR